MEATKILGSMQNLIVWDKGGGGMGDLTHSLSTDYELILAFNRGAEIKGKRLGSVWSIGKDAASSYIHATQKPVDLGIMAMQCFSKSQDTIIDPFLGSGMSLIAAEQLGDRTVIGFELSERYCSLILDRFEKLTGIEPELVGSL